MADVRAHFRHQNTTGPEHRSRDSQLRFRGRDLTRLPRQLLRATAAREFVMRMEDSESPRALRWLKSAVLVRAIEDMSHGVEERDSSRNRAVVLGAQ